MIDQKKLKELVKLMVDNGLTELDLQDEKERVALKRQVAGSPVQMMAAPMAAPQPAAAAPAPAAAAPTPPKDADEGLVAIVSPMVGTFYAAATPDAKAFVSPGDAIGEETVVCIIEAMKVFNEIKAEVKGTIAKVLVENGKPVEFGQKLYLVKPN